MGCVVQITFAKSVGDGHSFVGAFSVSRSALIKGSFYRDLGMPPFDLVPSLVVPFHGPSSPVFVKTASCTHFLLLKSHYRFIV